MLSTNKRNSIPTSQDVPGISRNAGLGAPLHPNALTGYVQLVAGLHDGRILPPGSHDRGLLWILTGTCQGADVRLAIYAIRADDISKADFVAMLPPGASALRLGLRSPAASVTIAADLLRSIPGIEARGVR